MFKRIAGKYFLLCNPQMKVYLLILKKITLDFLVKVNKSIFICVMLVLDLFEHLIVHFGYLFLKFRVWND